MSKTDGGFFALPMWQTPGRSGLTFSEQLEHVEDHSETRSRSWIGPFIPGWMSRVWSECWTEGRSRVFQVLKFSFSRRIQSLSAFRPQLCLCLLSAVNTDVYLKKPPRLPSWLKVKGQALVPCSDFSCKKQNKKKRLGGSTQATCWLSATTLYFRSIEKKLSFKYIG